MDEASQQSGAELTQSEVAAARGDEGIRLQSEPATGGTPVPPVSHEERAPEITPAGTLVLEGAESQAAAGAVNELQELRAKVGTLQTSLALVRTELENNTERVTDIENVLQLMTDEEEEEAKEEDAADLVDAMVDIAALRKQVRFAADSRATGAGIGR